jgi:hypothetical protein
MGTRLPRTVSGFSCRDEEGSIVFSESVAPTKPRKPSLRANRLPSFFGRLSRSRSNGRWTRDSICQRYVFCPSPDSSELIALTIAVGLLTEIIAIPRAHRWSGTPGTIELVGCYRWVVRRVAALARVLREAARTGLRDRIHLQPRLPTLATP